MIINKLTVMIIVICNSNKNCNTFNSGITKIMVIIVAMVIMRERRLQRADRDVAHRVLISNINPTRQTET